MLSISTFDVFGLLLENIFLGKNSLTTKKNNADKRSIKKDDAKYDF